MNTKTAARHLVDTLINREISEKKVLPVKVQVQSGEIVDADFNGYYDCRLIGRGFVPSIGYAAPGGAPTTHGPLRKGDTLLTPVPSPEEWAKETAA